MRRTLTAALLLLALWPATASASAPAPWQQKALALAQQTWRPACGQLTLSFGQPPEETADAAGWAYKGDCGINIRSDKTWLGYPEFCDTVLHEAGHAAGLEHSTNPRSVMFPLGVVMRNLARVEGSRREYVSWTGVDRRCLPTA